MDCVVTPLKTLMGFSVHLNVQVKFYNLPNLISIIFFLLNIVLKRNTQFFHIIPLVVKTILYYYHLPELFILFVLNKIWRKITVVSEKSFFC
ncbi:integral membrane protein [Ligilactobacillus acidipiscis]|nr:integral membrane protein [Ligilactobacillus acidipiscis]